MELGSGLAPIEWTYADGVRLIARMRRQMSRAVGTL